MRAGESAADGAALFFVLNHEKHEIHEKKQEESDDDAFGLDLGVVAEIDEQAQATASSLQVVVNLGTMRVSQFLEGLDFENDLIEKDEIRNVFLLQRLSLVMQGEFRLRLEDESLESELHLQALLIHRLNEAAPQFFVDFK